MNTFVAMLAGAALTGSVYMAGWGTCPSATLGSGAVCEDCAPVSRAMALSAPTPATIPAGVIDMKNTKCVVEGGDPMGPDVVAIYQGKAYHVCCTACLATFNKDPEKYVKAFEADPAKYGVVK